jgi:hypothetical protein
MKTKILTVLALFLLQLLPRLVLADKISFEPVNVTTIAPPELGNQALMVIEITFPDSTNLDSLSLISLAKLSVTVSYELSDSLPMTLECAPAIVGFSRDSLSIESIKSRPEQLIDETRLATASFGLNSDATAHFNITEQINWMIANSINHTTFIVFPIEGHSIFDGFSDTPTISISYIKREIDEN